MDIKTLKLLAKNARTVIEAAAKAGDHCVAFAKFPNGACGATADVLAQYLCNAYELDARCVCGITTGGRSHAWVVIDRTIIDITADQFGNDPVIVATESPWHAKWQSEPPRPPHTRGLESMLEALTVGMGGG